MFQLNNYYAKVSIIDFTEDRYRVRSGRHRLSNPQKEHNQCQQYGDLKVHLLARLNREEEAEEGDEEDEKARCDEVDDVEQTATAHAYSERDVRIELSAASVLLLVTLGCDAVLGYRPFLQQWHVNHMRT